MKIDRVNLVRCETIVDGVTSVGLNTVRSLTVLIHNCLRVVTLSPVTVVSGNATLPGRLTENFVRRLIEWMTLNSFDEIIRIVFFNLCLAFNADHVANQRIPLSCKSYS